MLSRKGLVWGLSWLCAACVDASNHKNDEASSTDTASLGDLSSDTAADIGVDTTGWVVGTEPETEAPVTDDTGSESEVSTASEEGVDSDTTGTDSSLDTASEGDSPADTASDVDSDTTGQDTGIVGDTDDPVVNDTDSASEVSTESDTATETDAVEGVSCVLANTIDDMESGTGHVCPFDDRNGVWYVFNDETEGAAQWPPLTTPGIPAPTAELTDGHDGSTRAMHTYGEGFGEWGAGIGLDLAYNDGAYGSYDVSAYDGVTFFAKSDLSSRVTFRVSTADTTRIEWGGHCQEDEECSWEPHVALLQFYPEWMQYWIPFDELESELSLPFDGTMVTNMQFLFEDWGEAMDIAFDFWVDDLSFYSGAPDCDDRCAAAPAGCDGELPIVDENLVNTLKRYADTSAPVTCSDVCWRHRIAAYGEVDSLEGLGCLHWITALEIRRGGVQDISPLATLSNLHSLNLADNGIVDISVLSGLSSLITLNLSENEISDLTPLASLSSLDELTLSGNHITDLTPLVQNEGLGDGDAVYLIENPIDCDTQAENIRALEDRGVFVAEWSCP